MIRNYTGNLGTGKTLHMVRDIVRDLKLGRRVITNTPISYQDGGRILKPIYLQSAEDFGNAIKYERKVVIAIDEAGILFSSAFWSKLPFEYITKFRQSRHADCDFYFTSQDFGDVVKPLRNLVNEVVECRKRRFMNVFRTLPKLNFRTWKVDKTPAIIFDAYVRDKKYAGKALWGRKGIQQFWYRDSMYPSEYRRLWQSYNTKQDVDPYVMIRKAKSDIKDSYVPRLGVSND